ncbi:MAG: DUF4333 domain-containing protein [Actinobacteria bacterium]|nr:DUF4333 domain-containing protein [Actinomycetota bacterium]
MKKLIVAAATAGLVLLAACSNDSTDFKENAEAFIESTEVETEAGTTFTDATCTKPAKVEAGETFTCTAVDASGATWDFDLEVKSENSYEIVTGQPRG